MDLLADKYFLPGSRLSFGGGGVRGGGIANVFLFVF